MKATFFWGGGILIEGSRCFGGESNDHTGTRLELCVRFMQIYKRHTHNISFHVVLQYH